MTAALAKQNPHEMLTGAGKINQRWVVAELWKHPARGFVFRADPRRHLHWSEPCGVWALAYAAFVASEISELGAWWQASGGDQDALWHDCSFAERPPLALTRKRFAMMTDHAGAIRTVIGELLR